MYFISLYTILIIKMVASLSLHNMSQYNNRYRCPNCPRHNLVLLFHNYHTMQWDIDVVISIYSVMLYLFH